MEMRTLRTEVKFALILLFWCVFATGVVGQFPLPGIILKLYMTALAAVVAFSAYGFGSLLIQRLPKTVFTSTEYTLFATMAGFGVLSLIMVILGALALWTHVAAIALVGAGLVSAWAHRENLMAPHSPGPDSGRGIGRIPLYLIFTGALVSFLIAFTPVTYYDSLVYHFALPQAYVSAGRWVGAPQLIYSAFPQVMEMIWTLGMLLLNDTVANLLGWVITALSVLAVYCFGKRFFGQATAAWAAAFLCVMPTYVLLSSGGYVDIALAAFAFMSLYAICLWREYPSSGLLVLAGVFGGCAFGTKYTGAIPLVIGALLTIIKEARSKDAKKCSISVILYSFSALIVVSPWLLKNLHYVGNPVFPFFSSLGIRPMNPWQTAAAAGYFRGISEYQSRTGMQLFTLLWDIAVHGLRFGGGIDILGGLGWATLFAFLPALALIRKRSPILSVILIYFALFFIVWGMTRPVLRFLLPVAPILALAAAYGFEEGVHKSNAGFRAVGHLVLGILLLSNARSFFEVTETLHEFRVPLGFESSDEYLSKTLNYFDAAGFVNSLPEKSLTYVIGDQRAYYYARPVIVTPVFNTNPLAEWANASNSAEDLASRFRSRGITHLLINRKEFARLENAYHLYPFTDHGRNHWEELCSRVAKRIYHDTSCDVFALMPGGAS